MARMIAFKAGDVISYIGTEYLVEAAYPYIAYIRRPSDVKSVCVGIGDLVMGGAHFPTHKDRDIFRYGPEGKPRQSLLTMK